MRAQWWLRAAAVRIYPTHFEGGGDPPIKSELLATELLGNVCTAQFYILISPRSSVQCSMITPIRSNGYPLGERRMRKDDVAVQHISIGATPAVSLLHPLPALARVCYLLLRLAGGCWRATSIVSRLRSLGSLSVGDGY